MPATTRSMRTRCIAPAVVLVGALVAFFIPYDPYEPHGTNLVHDDGFERPVREPGPPCGWQLDGRCIGRATGEGFGGSVGLCLAGSNGFVQAVYELPDPRPYQAFRVSGRVRVEGVRAGSVAWQAARLIFCCYDAQHQSDWGYPHVVFCLTGTKGWTTYEKVFVAPGFAVTAQVAAQHLGTAGTMWVDDVSVVPLGVKPAFHWWQILAVTLWAGVAANCVWQTRLWQRRWGPFVLAVAALIVVGIVLPQPSLRRLAAAESSLESTLTNPVAVHIPWLMSPLPASPDSQVPMKAQPESPTQRIQRLKRITHVSLFALLGFAAFGAWRREPPVLPDTCFREMLSNHSPLLVGLALFAAATEVLQFVSITRTPRIGDWLLDMSGLVCGAVLLYAAESVSWIGSGAPSARGASRGP